jgi:hypothetical protein
MPRVGQRDVEVLGEAGNARSRVRSQFLLNAGRPNKQD